MKEYIKKNKFNLITIIIYSIITLVLISYHENWRDEAQSWLIARDLNLIDLFKQLKYEGHPCLWYLILFPFAKLGFPYITENLISWIIMNITVWIILNKAPFDKWIKILFILSTPFIYLYPVISRSYCLIALAIVLIAITYKGRKEKPIQYVLAIVLLSYTHVIMFGLAGMLYVVFFIEELIIGFTKKTEKEKIKILISLLIAIISLSLLFIQLVGSLQKNANVNTNITINSQTIKSIGNNLANISGSLFGTEFKYPMLVLLIGMFIYELVKYPKNALIIFVTVIYQVFIYTFIYSVSDQRAAIVILIILLFACIQKEEIDKKHIYTEIVLLIILLANVILSVFKVEDEIKYNYSDAKDTAQYINENIKEGTFICSHLPISSAIIPYTKTKNYWSPHFEKYFSYTTWDNQNEMQNYVPIGSIILNINKKFENQEDIYFIYCYNWKEEDLKKFVEELKAKPIYTSEKNAIRTDEIYTIFKLYDKGE